MDRWDVLVLAGVVLLGVGLGLYAPWLGASTAGLVLLALGVVGAVSAERAGAGESGSPRGRGGEG